jgi:hypothetical protein
MAELGSLVAAFGGGAIVKVHLYWAAGIDHLRKTFLTLESCGAGCA